MKHNGNFWDESGGKNLITKFLTAAEQATTEASNEYAENWRSIKSQVTMDWELHLVRPVVNDSQYKDFDTFMELESELTLYHHKIGHNVGLPVHNRLHVIRT